MKWKQILFSLFFIAPFLVAAQTVQISDFDREDTRDMNFEIIGKMNGNILVYKNPRNSHKINIYDKEMNTLETVALDFVPNKSFNIDFVTFPDYFVMIYQYQKGNILNCMAVKMDAKAQKIGEPVLIDTTKISIIADNKIYSTIYSEDHKRIMIFKIQTRFQKFNMKTLLFDNEMNIIETKRYLLPYNERRDRYDNFSVGNDGGFVFTNTNQPGFRDYSDRLDLLMKSPHQDTLAYYNVDLNGKYIDEVKLKIDNRNNRYLINTFYYKNNRGNIDGLLSYVFDNTTATTAVSQFIEIQDLLRAEAKPRGSLRYALDNFFIRQVVVKTDGGYILSAEDFTSETRNSNPFNRYDYLYNPYSSFNSYGSYYYNPYTGRYRPYYGSGNQTTRYYYGNIIILNIDRYGHLVRSTVLPKDQYGDDEQNFMSFSTVTSGSEIHFLFNADRKYQIVSDQSIAADGTITRYPTLKSLQKGYEFMPSLSKQTGSRQIIIPCNYRNNICFAKIDF